MMRFIRAMFGVKPHREVIADHNIEERQRSHAAAMAQLNRHREEAEENAQKAKRAAQALLDGLRKDWSE